MKKILAIIFAPLVVLAQGHIQHIRCDVDGGNKLPDVEISQGSTPSFSFDVYNQSKLVAPDTNTVCRVMIAPALASQEWIVATNSAVNAKGYTVDFPTIGTNSNGKAWSYVAYFETANRVYWHGNGRIKIQATGARVDGTRWTEIPTDASIIQLLAGKQDKLIAGDNITINGNVISSTGGGGGGGTDESTVKRLIESETKGTNTLIHAEDDVTLGSIVLSGEGQYYFHTDGSINANGVEANYFTAKQGGINSSYLGIGIASGDNFLMFPNLSGEIAVNSWVIDTIGGTNHFMQLVGEDLSIHSIEANGETNELWKSSSLLGSTVSNLNNTASLHSQKIAALERRPDLTSWGDYAPDGTVNPDAESMVYLNKALLCLGSGFSWATSGSYACLAQSGAVAFACGTNGEIRIGVDVQTNYVSIVQGGSVVVGCRATGFRVNGNIAEIDYGYAGGDFPSVWFTGDLITDNWQLTAPVWIDNGNGTATATVPVNVSRGFFKATSSQSLGAYFKSNIPALFPEGVYGDITAPPVKYDSVITIQQGGNSYRIPAQLVR